MKHWKLDHKNCRKVMWLLMTLGGVVPLIFWDSPVALAFGGVCIVLGLAVIFLFWRCPYCSCMLPSREGCILYCPSCGEKLDEAK